MIVKDRLELIKIISDYLKSKGIEHPKNNAVIHSSQTIWYFQTKELGTEVLKYIYKHHRKLYYGIGRKDLKKFSEKLLPEFGFSESYIKRYYIVF